jgi:hypothetical protein
MKAGVFVLLFALLAASCDESTTEASSNGGNEAGRSALSRSSHASGDKEIEAATIREGKSSERVPRTRKPPLATAVEGQPGKVLSPFTNEVVDVGGRSPGDVIDDPRFPGDATKRFEVPQLSNTIPEAKPVPGKVGFVFSPYNNKVIDVTGIKPGLLVADPTFPPSEKKHFRIPIGAGTDSSEGLLPENIDGLPIRTGPDGSLLDSQRER